MNIENAVMLTADNINKIREIVGAGQPVGFTMMEQEFSPDSHVTSGIGYTFHGLDGDGDLQFKNDRGANCFIKVGHLTHAKIALHASEQDVERFHAEALGRKKVLALGKLVDLRAKVNVLLSNNDGFSVGDAIEWKEGMKNSKFPAYGEPVVVVEKLDTPVIFEAEYGSQYFASREDIVVATMKDDDLCLYSMDSRRFKLFSE